MARRQNDFYPSPSALIKPTDNTSVAWFIWNDDPSPDISLFVDWK